MEKHYGILIENWIIAEPFFSFFKFVVAFTGSFAKFKNLICSSLLLSLFDMNFDDVCFSYF